MRDDDLQLSLVWQAKNGNAQALNALLDANKGKIYAAAYALLKNREDAEDAMQQALIAVWQNIGKLAAPEAFETWLYRVTYTRSLNILKSRKNNEMVIENDIGDMPQAALLESELMLPHEYAERNDLRERLFLIIDSLSPVQRETVVLYYFHDKSVGEISEIMDCSAGTVKSRLYLARNTIRTEIEEQERKSGQKLFGFAVGAVPLGRFVAENTAKTMLSPQAGARILFAARQAAFAGGAAATTGAAAGAAATAATGGISLGAKIGIIASCAAVTATALGVGAKLIADKINEPHVSTANAVSETVPTQQETAPPAQTQAPTEPRNRAAYTAFLQALQAEEQAVRDYDWQKFGYPQVSGSKSVAFADIIDDDTPEMILSGCFDQEDTERANALLKIYSYQNGTAQCVYTMKPDEELSGLDHAEFKTDDSSLANFALYQREGEKTLYLYAYGENGLKNYSLIRSFDGTSMKTLVLQTKDRSGDSEVTEYFSDGQKVEEAVFTARANELAGNPSAVLMLKSSTNYGPYRPGFEEMALSSAPTAMTCDDAMTFLLKESGDESAYQTALPIAGTYNFFLNEEEHYSLTIREDGTFACVYLLDGNFLRDSSKSRYSTMRGRITDLKKTGDSIYTFKLSNRRLDQSPGTGGWERIYNETVQVTYTENGMDSDSELTVYLNGTELSALPDTVLRKYQYKVNSINDIPLSDNLLYDSKNDWLFFENYGIDRYSNN